MVLYKGSNLLNNAMEKPIYRINYIKNLIIITLIFSLYSEFLQSQVKRTGGPKLKLSLNAYSFNEPLKSGQMDLDQLLEFCASQNFDALDITAYYFPGYPKVPSDEYLYSIKKKAFLLGLDISGTGVKNDFSDPDENKRKEGIQLVKDWIDAAEKLGAPVIRIFAGTSNTDGYSWDQVASWMVKDIKYCVEYGKKHGVLVAIQNHHDFIKTSGETIKIIKMVDSDWFGLILDTGSYREGDPYDEIAKSAPFAVNWQIKETLFVNNKEEKADLKRIVKIIKASGYRGYIPIETLGQGDPKIKVPVFLRELKSVLD